MAAATPQGGTSTAGAAAGAGSAELPAAPAAGGAGEPDTATTDYDVVVLGAGSTGENVADRVVQGGCTAALVEADLVGGGCSYWACMPSKALLRGSQVLAAARAVDGAAQAVTGRQDVAATLRRRDAFAARWSDTGQVSWAESHGIDVVRGHGRLAGPRQVVVRAADGTERTLRARHAVAICTGSEPALPPIPGLSDAHPWTTKQATSATTPPASMVVIGGGPAGCEMAQAWSALGSTVTLVEMAPRLLPGLEPFAGELLADGLRTSGVDVRTGATVTGVERAGSGDGGPVTVHTDGGALTAQVLLVAAGRRPRTGDLGLETVGLAAEEDGRPAWLGVDDTGLVGSVAGEWLYAAGDVVGRVLLTHQGKYEARAFGAAIVARARGERVEPVAWTPWSATADHAAVPSVVFTHPEVAAVGRTEEQARAGAAAVRSVEYAIGDVAGAALTADGYTGRAKLVVDEECGVVVGATFVGPGVAELLHAATIAIVGEVPLDRLWHAVPAYPTVSEVWLRLLEAYGL